MNRSRKALAAAFAVALLAAVLGACQKQEGPAERAGKEIDQAVQQAGQELQKAGQQIQDAAEQAKK
jgi:hypothetical protein